MSIIVKDIKSHRDWDNWLRKRGLLDQELNDTDIKMESENTLREDFNSLSSQVVTESEIETIIDSRFVQAVQIKFIKTDLVNGNNILTERDGNFQNILLPIEVGDTAYVYKCTIASTIPMPNGASVPFKVQKDTVPLPNIFGYLYGPDIDSTYEQFATASFIALDITNPMSFQPGEKIGARCSYNLAGPLSCIIEYTLFLAIVQP